MFCWLVIQNRRTVVWLIFLCQEMVKRCLDGDLSNIVWSISTAFILKGKLVNIGTLSYDWILFSYTPLEIHYCSAGNRKRNSIVPCKFLLVFLIPLCQEQTVCFVNQSGTGSETSGLNICWQRNRTSSEHCALGLWWQGNISFGNSKRKICTDAPLPLQLLLGPDIRCTHTVSWRISIYCVGKLDRCSLKM